MSLQYAIFYYNKNGENVKRKDPSSMMERHHLKVKLTPKKKMPDDRRLIEKYNRIKLEGKNITLFILQK